MVIQLKAMSGALSADESFSNSIVDKTGLLQRMLVYIVSIICNFIDKRIIVNEKAQLYTNTTGFSGASGGFPSESSNSASVPFSETRLNWHRKAVVSVMEAGGLNWLVGKVGTIYFSFSCHNSVIHIESIVIRIRLV